MLGSGLLILRGLDGLDIVPLLCGRNRQAFYLSAGYLLELGFPAFLRPGDEEKDQAVPRLTKSIVCCNIHLDIDGARTRKWVFS